MNKSLISTKLHLVILTLFCSLGVEKITHFFMKCVYYIFK
jgi:hypothetical protein